MHVVITDLDGTLLDHETYSFASSAPAIELLRRRRIPLVLCTSKTRAEAEHWRRLLANEHPFIVENGGALFLPAQDFQLPMDGAEQRDGYQVIPLGAPYAELVDALRGASAESGCTVRGFSEMSVGEVAANCGMDEEQAALARLREFDEPFLILDPARTPALLAAIERRGLRWVRGGRFHHILGGSDKAAAVRRLLQVYRAQHVTMHSIGLGDGMNDAPFLNEVDIPILMPTPWLAQLQAAVPGGMPACHAGSRGWNQAILNIFRE